MQTTELKDIHSWARNAETGDKILVIGRDPFSSDLLATALTQSLGCSAASASASSLPKKIASGKVRLAIISADLSGISGEGFNLANSISRAHPHTPIVILLNEASPEAVIRAFRSGASGVFCQEEPMTELLHCIEHVGSRLIWAGKKASAMLLELLKNMPSPGSLAGSEAGEPLTDREWQVVQCAATGMTNKSIAAQLHLSEHTVKNYLFRAFPKLGVSNRVELLFYLSSRGHLAGQPFHTFNRNAVPGFSSEQADETSTPGSPSPPDAAP